jgi:hypothetical protein
MDTPSQMDLSRRGVFTAAATTLLLGALARSRAWAGGTPEALDAWARSLVELNLSVGRQEIGVTEWQDRVTRLNQSIPVGDLVRYLSIETLTEKFRYPSLLAETADPLLPLPELYQPGWRQRWFVRVFGLKRGGAIIPHVHNNMVSAHLVISGSFHLRTHDRVRDEADAVVLRPSIDRVIHPGEAVSMSDQRDNQHWFVAEEDRSMTFDVGVVRLPASSPYGLKANSYNMIFLDADRRPERDGLVVAPVMSFEECAAKYA